MTSAALHRNDPITLLPSYEHVRVMVAGKNCFTVCGHVMVISMAGEGKSWVRGHVDIKQSAPGGKE